MFRLEILFIDKLLDQLIIYIVLLKAVHNVNPLHADLYMLIVL